MPHPLCTSGLRRAVEIDQPPWRACFSNMPVEHDGTNAFKFRVAFREAIKIDFRIFWDHSLTVTGRLCP